MKLYNSITRQKEELITHVPRLVSFYTCGPTVYHYAHIGNLRTYIFEDILEKSLKYLGYKVDRVMNITDIGHLEGDSDDGEDKMLKSAKSENKSVRELADFYTKAFILDLERLNILVPTKIYNASDNVDFYIKMISRIIEKGYAYVGTNGNVYFDTEKFLKYQALTNRVFENNLVGARDDVHHDTFKKNPADFALWFVDSKFNNQEMKWDSPFGKGYPGWHIECSGIAIKHFGEYLDIHAGGIDNYFPHHINEIAQSEAYLGHDWCHMFVHGEHLNMGKEKMSKSLGNVFTLNTLIEKEIDPIDYRFFVLNSHYRNQLSFDIDKVKQAGVVLKKVRSKCRLLGNTNLESENTLGYIKSFIDYLDDDLNTSKVLTLLYDVLKSDLFDEEKRYLVSEFDKVLSLNLLDKVKISDELKQIIEDKIELREKYKKEKNYEKADEIRNYLTSLNVVLEDKRDGTTNYEVME